MFIAMRNTSNARHNNVTINSVVVVIVTATTILCIALLLDNVILSTERLAVGFYLTELLLHTANGFQLFVRTFSSLFRELA